MKAVRPLVNGVWGSITGRLYNGDHHLNLRDMNTNESYPCGRKARELQPSAE